MKRSFVVELITIRVMKRPMQSIRLLLPLFASAVLLSACKNEQDRAVDAAARSVANAQVLGPGDMEIMSTDQSVGLQVMGDSVRVFMPNSVISVPATHIQNIKYENNRLRFDIDGFGMKIFDVGDGTEGVVFNQLDALAFVAAVVQRQADMEQR